VIRDTTDVIESLISELSDLTTALCAFGSSFGQMIYAILCSFFLISVLITPRQFSAYSRSSPTKSRNSVRWRCVFYISKSLSKRFLSSSWSISYAVSTTFIGYSTGIARFKVEADRSGRCIGGAISNDLDRVGFGVEHFSGSIYCRTGVTDVRSLTRANDALILVISRFVGVIEG
jgi:hypothetical protein